MMKFLLFIVLLSTTVQAAVVRSITGNSSCHPQVSLDLASSQVAAVQETLPQGVFPENISNGGVPSFDEMNHRYRISWAFLGDPPDELQYAINGTEDIAGVIMGTSSFEGAQTEIIGDSQLTIYCPPSAARSIDNNHSCAPVVTLNLSFPRGATIIFVKEVLPAGLVPASISDSGSFNATISEIHWALSGTGITSKTVSYTVTGVGGTITGTISFDGVQQPTTGSGGVTVVCNTLIVTLPLTATEGDGVLAGAGDIYIPTAATQNLIVNLASNDTTELTVPPTVTILAGATSAQFDATVQDDTEIDGPQTVSVTATNAAFPSASFQITILDNDGLGHPLDIDHNGRMDALTDGVLIVRYLAGMRGAALVAGAVASDCTSRCGAGAIEVYLQAGIAAAKFDVDGNGVTDVNRDGMLLLRYLFGFRGANLTNNIDLAASPACQRCSPQAIESYLLQLH